MRDFTENQKRAILSDKDDIIVSAGAGSGKTTVLTERIFNLLNNPELDVDVSDMLVITFTKSSAADLRNKVYDRITDEIALNPDNKKLKKQLIKLPSAQISTIDSFLKSIVFNNTAELNISVNSRIAGEDEISDIKSSIIGSVIDECYDEIEDFDAFVSLFTADTDVRLKENFLPIVNDFYTKSITVDYLTVNIDELKKVDSSSFFSSTAYGRIYTDYYTKMLKDIGAKLEYLNGFYKGCDGYDLIEPKISNGISNIKNIIHLFDKDFNSLMNYLASVKDNKVNYGRGYDKENGAVAAYEKYNKIIKDIKIISEEQLLFERDNTVKYLSIIKDFFGIFDKRFNEEKRRRYLLDFTDLSLMTLKLFDKYNEIPEKTAEKYKYVFVDEYQDVNQIQQNIFNKLQKHGSKFFRVGDVKQSIYGFRGAVPSNFDSLKFKYLSGEQKEGETIILSENFRCDSSVIDLCNEVSRNTFFTGTFDSSYIHEIDKLIYAKVAGDLNLEPELYILQKTKDKPYEEYQFICEKINKLQRDGFALEDIAILVRTNSKKAVIRDILNQNGIPCSDAGEGNFFDKPEIHTIISILKTVNNSSDDINVASALLSPVFNVTLDELETLKIEYKDSSLTLFEICEKSNDLKFKRFINKINEYKKYELGKSSIDLINYIYRDTFIKEIYGTSAAYRLNSFRDLSANYEKNSFKGLYRFLNFVDSYHQQNLDIIRPDGASGVNLMTIHQSKGLEYKVVILADALSPFKYVRNKDIFFNNSKVGCALKFPDDTGYGIYDSIFTHSVNLANKIEVINEEWRLLYVAMTRAINKLIITASPQRVGTVFSVDSFIKQFDDAPVTNVDFSDNISYLKAIILSVMNNDRYQIHYGRTSMISSVKEDLETKYGRFFSPKEIAKVKEKIIYKYPYEIAYKDIPLKLSVSKLYPSVLDEIEEDETVIVDESDFKTPDFIYGKSANSALKGTYTHAFMQFCNFKNLIENGYIAESERLLKSNLMTDEMLALIDSKSIESLSKSSLFKSAAYSDFLKKESDFTVNMPASNFTESNELKKELEGERVLIQGVIDCIFKDENGNFIIFDYKTDRFIGNDKADFIKILLERHSDQLTYYKKAVEMMYNVKTVTAYIYSFALNDFIEVK